MEDRSVSQNQKLTTPPHRYGVKKLLAAKIKCVAAEAGTLIVPPKV
jgi:hypothetical protein